MRAALLLSLALAGAAAIGTVPSAHADIMPQLGPENPRLQTVRYVAGETYRLTALPETGLTIMLEPGEQITRVTMADQFSLSVSVSAERDSLLLIPRAGATQTQLSIHTDRRDYDVSVTVAAALTAAYLVRFQYEDQALQMASDFEPELTGEIWSYRLRGNRELMPERITDDGVRTRIIFAPEQSLPAIFAIGPTGKEQVVNGYMRGGIFVIDRVHRELVFRIDKDKVTARRSKQPEDTQ